MRFDAFSWTREVSEDHKGRNLYTILDPLFCVVAHCFISMQHIGHAVLTPPKNTPGFEPALSSEVFPLTLHFNLQFDSALDCFTMCVVSSCPITQ